MARPANPNNRYAFTCKVTSETIKTNPKQFAELAARYGITPEELDNSYVGRKGRKKIEAENLTPAQAVEKYGIHINVANSLKCTNKKAGASQTSETPSPVTASEIEVSETETKTVEKTDSSYSVSIRADAEDTEESVVAA